MSTISTIIAAHNAQETLAETLESVFGQSRPADEIIVVDDGSTDATRDIVLNVMPRVRLIRQDRSGAAAALNTGIAAAAGDYMAFLDADDLWSSDKLARQADVLDARDAIAGVGGYMRTFICPTVSDETAARYRLPAHPEPCWLLGALLLRRQCFAACGVFSEDLYTGFNIDWFDRAQMSGMSFTMLDAVLLHRRIRPGSLSHRSARGDMSMVAMARRAIARRRAKLP